MDERVIATGPESINARTRTRCTFIVHKALAVVRPQFRLDFHDGIHGVSHWSRVWLHGRAIAASLDVNPAVPAWFSFLHDSQRRNDGHDPEHGVRAAEFAMELRKQGVITELNHREFEHLCEAMRLHSDGHTQGEPAILACWDADRLDLGRVKIKPQPARLCTSYAKHHETIQSAFRMSQKQPRNRSTTTKEMM